MGKYLTNSLSNLQFLTPRQVAAVYQVKEVTVRTWLRRKLIKGVKIGHSWRIPRSAIEEEGGKNDFGGGLPGSQ